MMQTDELPQNNSVKSFSLTLTSLSTHLYKAVVTIGPEVVKKLYKQTIHHYQQHLSLSGFQKISPYYIDKHYQKDLTSTMKGFLFSHVALTFLKDKLTRHKILLVNVPRLTMMTIKPTMQAIFSFDLSVAQPVELKEWKNFAFKIPKRKNYKDLDKQVSTFLKQEQTSLKKRDKNLVEENDWVCFSAHLVDSNNHPLLLACANILWIKITTDNISHPLPEVFLKKEINETFISNKLTLEKSFDSKQHGRYTFLIRIRSIIKGSHLSVDYFKSYFKLKSKTDIHKKLIEVFSYRNDLSQRKAIIEELFHLFFSKHRFEVPKHIVLRKQEDIVLSLMQHPDYQVYKTDKNFKQQVEKLAEKQLKEEILIDQIAYKEEINVDEKDIHSYLHLFNNERLKEFIYFKPTLDDIENPETPLHPSVIRQSALREKTLNHIIYVLTK